MRLWYLWDSFISTECLIPLSSVHVVKIHKQKYADDRVPLFQLSSVVDLLTDGVPTTSMVAAAQCQAAVVSASSTLHADHDQQQRRDDVDVGVATVDA